MVSEEVKRILFYECQLFVKIGKIDIHYPSGSDGHDYDLYIRADD